MVLEDGKSNIDIRTSSSEREKNRSPYHWVNPLELRKDLTVANAVIDDGECQYCFPEQPIFFIDLFKPHLICSHCTWDLLDGGMALHS